MPALRCAMLVAVALTVHAAAPGGEPEANLVRNPTFAEAGAEGAPAAAWSAISPEWTPAACRVRRTDGGLRVDAPDEPYAVGGVEQTVAGIEPGRAYAVEAEGACDGIVSPARSVLVRLRWLKDGRRLHPAGWLVRGPDRVRLQVADAIVRVRFRDVFVAPEDADAARLALEVKWPGRGNVVWKRASLVPADPPKPRKVTIGTVFFRPRNTTVKENLDLWCAKIDEAGRRKCDIVCLGEAILKVGTNAGLDATAAPIPGPHTERLGEAARRNRLWVVAGLAERAGRRVCNTAVLLDRTGRLAGTYRKIHLPREEWVRGVTPGRAYPVFETDFGRVAMMICYDWFFPEAAEAFALRGAEVLFAPTWGNTWPDPDDGRAEGETVFRVRARDAGLYLVPAVYDGRSMIVDPMGRILAAGKTEGVYVATVDLAERERLPWVGHWRSIGPRHRMPETYEPLTEPPARESLP
ncbi:MAG: carbon-nitrogen hydrolase family protein [Phycisphaerae bacterium]